MKTDNLAKITPNQGSIVYMDPTIQIEGGQGTLKDPKYKTQMGSGAIVHPQPPIQKPPVVAAQYGRNLSILTPTGVAVRTNSNPISRYNFSIEQYESSCNKIQGIQLLKVKDVVIQIPICCPVAYLYDFLIFFYESFFLTLTCVHPSGRGILCNLLFLALYVLILMGPYISIIQLAFTSIFFIFYIIGVVISCINKSRLGYHSFTQNMVPSAQIPFYPKDYLNQYYTLENEQVRGWVYSHPDVTFFQYIIQNHKAKFMAYTIQFLTERYNYINSCKMIAFHAIFMTSSALGLVASVAAFPKLYGR